MPKNAALFYDYPLDQGEVFGAGRRERIAALTELYPEVVNASNFQTHAGHLAGTEVIFATWGMPSLTETQLAQLPSLKAVFYAAGNVKAFAQPLIDHDITLVSAWAINAIPVAEMCLSQVLLSCRGYFRAVRQYREVKSLDSKAFWRPGVSGETVGLIGMGFIGSRLRELLKPYELEVIAHDPLLTEERAQELGVERVSLGALFRRAYVVSNHVPDLTETRGMLDAALFETMRSGATFINTGRGAQVVEADLIRVLQARPDLTALTDVTWPEPPLPDSSLWTLPNMVMSPHIGGTIGNEVTRLADRRSTGLINVLLFAVSCLYMVMCMLVMLYGR
ncbi:MAG: hydroxyacid dehydrogenase [Pseudomonadota bacterium]